MTRLHKRFNALKWQFKIYSSKFSQVSLSPLKPSLTTLARCPEQSYMTISTSINKHDDITCSRYLPN